MQWKREYTIIRDHREKRPLLIPAHIVLLRPDLPPTAQTGFTASLTVVEEELETADYLLKGHESLTIIERKGALDEVATNCLTTSGRRKFADVCRRLRDACSDPVLLLEGDARFFTQPTARTPEPAFARDALQRLLMEYQIELMLMPKDTIEHRRANGEFAAARLINGTMIGRM
jgi:ERCC4-type nuclease